jgi:hypothetical protein
MRPKYREHERDLAVALQQKPFSLESYEQPYDSGEARMTFDLSNPVVALCVAGVEREGTPAEALALYERAWAARTDAFDASVAAHYVARLQPTPDLTLHWNAMALEHAELVSDARLATLLPSLCLNLAESYRLAGRTEEAHRVARRGHDALADLPTGGYADMVRGGLDRVLSRLDVAGASTPVVQSTPTPVDARDQLVA